MALKKQAYCKQCSNYPDEGSKSPNACTECRDGSGFIAKNNPFRQKKIIELDCPICGIESDVVVADSDAYDEPKTYTCGWCNTKLVVKQKVEISYTAEELKEDEAKV